MSEPKTRLSSSDPLELAILGGGPIGIEAALYAARSGVDVTVFEADKPGHHVDQWGHVEFFSPWELNRSEWGCRALDANGHPLADPDAYPTGREYLNTYLGPLTDLPDLAGSIVTDARVEAVSRRDARKSQYIGDDARSQGPFVVAVDIDGSRQFREFDAVIDATGSYRTPNGLGPGGIRAQGEERAAAAGDIDYWIPDILGDDRHQFDGQRVMVVGEGYSAVTSIQQLLDLKNDSPDTHLHWLRSSDAPPYAEIDDDPLPQRKRLAELGNRVVRDGLEEMQTHVGTIERLERRDDGLAVTFADRKDSIEVDTIIANVGYRPDIDLFRDLQVHLCYATEGPMSLAATLIGDDSADCLDQSSGGLDTLTNPEPDFFVLGSKSYGRNSRFLLSIGFEQIQTVIDALVGE
jgi:thioredoxin reductase